MSRGPNFKRLCAHVMSMDAVPAGGGMAAAIAFLIDPQRITAAARKADEWVATAIKAVREAPGENPWRDADDEAVCGEVLRRIDEKKQKRRSAV